MTQLARTAQLILAWLLLAAFLAFTISNSGAIFGRDVLAGTAMLATPFLLFALGSVLVHRYAGRAGTWIWMIYMIIFAILYWLFHPIAQGWEADFWGYRWMIVLGLTILGSVVNAIVLILYGIALVWRRHAIKSAAAQSKNIAGHLGNWPSRERGNIR